MIKRLVAVLALAVATVLPIAPAAMADGTPPGTTSHPPRCC